MKLLNFSVLLVITFSLFSLSVLAQATGTTTTSCTKITDSKGNLGLSVGKLAGLCAEFFDNPQKMTFFVLLPAVLFGIVIWGVLEEIGLFAAKPGIHVALAILLSMMLLPTGAFGQVALVIYSGGAMAAVMGVGGVFILGLTFWIRKKIHSYGYAGMFSGWMGWAITSVGIGFVGYFVGQPLGQAWTGALVGAVLGFVWGFFGGKGRGLRSAGIEFKIDDMEKRIKEIDIDLAKKKSKLTSLPNPPTPRTKGLTMQLSADVAGLEAEKTQVETMLKELREEHQLNMVNK